MRFFRDEEHVERWCAAREMNRGVLLGADQGWRLAKGWYGSKLHPDWRRHTLAEAESLFESIGLTGEFWNLRG